MGRHTGTFESRFGDWDTMTCLDASEGWCEQSAMTPLGTTEPLEVDRDSLMG